MALTKKQISDLNKIIETTKKLIANLEVEAASGKGPTRSRRSSAEAKKMRAEIKAARAKGVPAAKLAEKYGTSTAYIYMIK